MEAKPVRAEPRRPRSGARSQSRNQAVSGWLVRRIMGGPPFLRGPGTSTAGRRVSSRVEYRQMGSQREFEGATDAERRPVARPPVRPPQGLRRRPRGRDLPGPAPRVPVHLVQHGRVQGVREEGSGKGVSVSGVRGIVGDGLSPEIVEHFAAAFGSDLGGKSVVLSRDSRPSGDDAAARGRRRAARRRLPVIDIGIAPTPTGGLAVRQLERGRRRCRSPPATTRRRGTASSCSAPTGPCSPAAEGEQVRGLFEIRPSSPARRGTRSALRSRRRRARRPRPTGARPGRRGALAPQRFRELPRRQRRRRRAARRRSCSSDLGCAVVQSDCEPTAYFVHEPEPIPAHLGDVAPWVHAAESPSASSSTRTPIGSR